MSADSQIRINALLLQREALFVRIHEIERSVSALLREPYPFTRPALPSDQRVKRKTPARAAADTTLPEYALRVTGAARLVLVINLSSFVTKETADAFRHLRGSEAFAEALRTLHPHAPFGRDDTTDTVERDGYALRIFRSRLVYNHFFPTYRFGWDSTMRTRLEEMGCADVGRWQQWSSRVRLTRNGLAMITLERSRVSISVARTWMRRTRPSSPLTLMMSPTRIGRSASRIRPETKFDTTDCRPKPIPIDKAPATSVIFWKSTPSCASASEIAPTTPR